MKADEFSLLIQDVVMGDPAQVQKMARRAGKTYSTLIREANPFDTGAKLGAETLLRIMEASQDVRPLEYMARQFGFELRKVQDSVPHDF